MKPYILIAEDDLAQTKLIINALKIYEDEYSLLIAKNGREAFEMAQQYIPSLIMMNWHMPIMSGLGLY